VIRFSTPHSNLEIVKGKDVNGWQVHQIAGLHKCPVSLNIEDAVLERFFEC
jgi:hypothetical protein